MRNRRIWIAMTMGWLLAGCGDDGGSMTSGESSGSASGSTTTAATASTTAATTTTAATSGEPSTSSGATVGDTGQTTGVCTPEPATATPALFADVIFALDNSGSMVDEAAAVQAGLNGFADVLAANGVDVHVAAISADSNNARGLCIPAPFGSGACPDDENLPAYRHIVQTAGSNNALDLIVSNFPNWSASLRSDATRSVLVISDDDSTLAADAFTTAFTGLDPTLSSFLFHAIGSPVGSPAAQDPSFCAICAAGGTPCTQCDECCRLNAMVCTTNAADPSAVYDVLAQQTGGVFASICGDVGMGLSDIAVAIADDARAQCRFEIPPNPSGGPLDLAELNVAVNPDANTPGPDLDFVPGGLGDCNGPGWTVDSVGTPTQILLCPDSCTEVLATATAEVEARFGCPTQGG